MAGIKTRDLIQKIIKAKRAGDVTQAVEALSSNPSAVSPKTECGCCIVFF
jgi:hypothetical protein